MIEHLTRIVCVALLVAGFGLCGQAHGEASAAPSSARAEDGKALARRWFDEVINRRDLDAIAGIYGPNYVHHGPAGAEIRGLEAVRRFAAAILAASDDRRAVVEQQVAEGDLVVTRFTSTGHQTGAFRGAGSTGELWTTEGIVISRVEAGRIVEDWEIVHHSGVAAPAPPASETLDSNKELVRRFTEASNAADWDALTEILAEGFTRHSAATAEPPVTSRDGFIRLQRSFLVSFPDQRVTLGRLVAEGDYVTALATYTGTQEGPLGDLPASGKAVESPFLAMFRIDGERIAELWVEWDNLAMLTQLGLFPPPEPPG